MKDLKKSAKTLDVKLEIYSSVNHVVVHGEHSAVTTMVGEIWRRLNEMSEQNRALERAKLPSKSTWQGLFYLWIILEGIFGKFLDGFCFNWPIGMQELWEEGS